MHRTPEPDHRPSPSPPPPPPTDAPFHLRAGDVETLLSSDGFTILRQHLALHYTYDFCHQHTPAQPDLLSRWLIVRDTLHAILVPVVELYDKAVLLATSAAVRSHRPARDPASAFTGEARAAFVWLQATLSCPRRRDWCYTRGCPACVAERSLESEASVRLLYAACLLSDVHYPFTISGPTLPSFVFFLHSLHRALQLNPLFAAPDFFELMHAKAVTTRNGIEDLIHQSLDLEPTLLSQPASSASPELAQDDEETKQGDRIDEMLDTCWTKLQHSGDEGPDSFPRARTLSVASKV